MDYSTVQFRDAANVLSAYEQRGIPNFSIRNRQQLLHVYKGGDLGEGATELAAFLELLERSKSAGIYTLCVYELAPNTRITNKTEYDGSFNFRFSDEISNGAREVYSRETESKLNALQSEIAMLREQLEEKEKPEEGELMGMINGIVNNPSLAPIVGAVAEQIAAWISKLGPQQPQQQQQHLQQPNLNHQATVEGLKRVSGIDIDVEQSLQVLCGAEKNFPELLHKMAQIALKKPTTFKIYVNLLRSYKI
jgi:uncharacterized small protein (DUF1192 family)